MMVRDSQYRIMIPAPRITKIIAINFWNNIFLLISSFKSCGNLIDNINAENKTKIDWIPAEALTNETEAIDTAKLKKANPIRLRIP